MSETLKSTFADCFIGPEPVAMKAGDARVLVNGAPIPNDFRIISESNYRRVMAVVERAGMKIDECDTRPTPGEDKPLGIEEVVGRAVMQEVVRYGPDAVKRYGRAAIEAYEQAHASTGEKHDQQ